MAYRMSPYKVGDFVYPVYKPQQAGQVVEVKPALPYPNGKGAFAPDLVVQRPSGERETINALHVKDFRALVEDHRRKLSTHLALLTKLESMDLTPSSGAV